VLDGDRPAGGEEAAFADAVNGAIDDNVAAPIAALQPVEAVRPRPSADTIHDYYKQV
jgi:hypothetical protein